MSMTWLRNYKNKIINILCRKLTVKGSVMSITEKQV